MNDKVIKSLVQDKSRMSFLPSMLPKHYLHFEQLVYAFMDKYCEDYNGGYWHYYSLDNGGFYICLDSNKDFKVCNPMNYFDDDMGADAVSISVSMFALNYLANTAESQDITDLYYLLYDYAMQHNEMLKIARFID